MTIAEPIVSTKEWMIEMLPAPEDMMKAKINHMTDNMTLIAKAANDIRSHVIHAITEAELRKIAMEAKPEAFITKAGGAIYGLTILEDLKTKITDNLNMISKLSGDEC